MRTCALIALTCLTLMTTACQHTNLIRQTETADYAALDGIVESGIDQKLYPGGVLIVGRGDDIKWAKAYGRHTYDPDSPAMTLDTIFDLASVSKVVGTTSAALVNIEDGKIDLDDKVSEYIDGFNTNGKEPVTIRDLMTHVSGLKAYETYSKVDESRGDGESQADALIRWYAALPASYEPRKDTKYSCLNFQTMARVNENARGERMGDLLKERVYGPLDMNDTGYLLTDEQKARTAPTYRDGDGEPVRGTVHDPLARYHKSVEHCPGNAGLYSTAPDLAIYCRMILGQGEYHGARIYDAETIHQATIRQTPKGVDEDRGLGFDVYEVAPYITDLNREPGKHVVGHFGYTGTMIWMDQLTGSWFVLLTNRTWPAKDGATDQSPSINPIRQPVCTTILRNQPEYRDWFAKKDAEKKEKTKT